MSDYYEASDIASAFTTARIEPVEAEFAAIEAGFAKLPALRKLREGRVTYVVAGGSANTLTASLDVAPDDYQDGMNLRIKTASANTGAVTLNVNSLGAVSVVDRNGSALTAGALTAGHIAEVAYLGGSFRLMNSGADAIAATAAAAAAAASEVAAATSETNASNSEDAAAASAAAAAISESNAEDSETASAASAAAAAASAVDASNAAAASLRATSATSHSTGTGSKAFTLDADAAFGPGQAVAISSDSDPANENMSGTITDYDPGTDVLTVDITVNNVTGPHTDWTIVIDAGSGVAWGSITGTLASQTDLNSALGSKAAAGNISSSGLTVNGSRLVGRATGGVGVLESITLGTGLAFSGFSVVCTVTGMTYPAAGIPVSTGSAWGTPKAAPSGAIVGTTDAQTLTNKRIGKRVVPPAGGVTSGPLTPNADTTDVFKATGLTGAITMNAPSGTPTDQQMMVDYFEDNGTSRAITWNAVYVAATNVTLPTATVVGKWIRVIRAWNADNSVWDVLSVLQEV